MESNIPSAEIILKWNGNSLTDDKKTVTQYGIAEGDMLFLQRARRAAPPGMCECYESAVSNMLCYMIQCKNDLICIYLYTSITVGQAFKYCSTLV